MKLSLIIPVYKVEPFIYQCLDSIRSQYKPEYSLEVILVNDGTPDRSMEVVQPLLKEMPYVTLINQENQGLSVARNNGLQASQGDYVWFIDSDDWLLPHALSYVFLYLEQYPDVPLFATVLEMHEEQTEKVYREYYPSLSRLTGREYLTKRFKQGASQRFIFKKSFLVENHLSFYPGILHEDGLFGYKMLYLAHDIVILKEAIYAYRIRSNGSIMSSISMKTPVDLLFIHQQLLQFCNTVVREEDRCWYRAEIYRILKDLFSFSRNLVDSQDFIRFYRTNRSYFRKESLWVMAHARHVWLGLRILVMPLTYWKIHKTLKCLLKK